MAYLSWSFLKMGEKAERSTSFLFLLMAGVPVLFAAFFAFVAGMTAILYAGPVLALMLLPFYLPCALREEKTRNACSRNILFGRKPLAVSFRVIARDWVYVIYAVLPALPFLFPGGNMAQAGLGNEQSLTAFFLMWISLYAVFAVLAVSWKGAVFEAGRGVAGCRRQSDADAGLLPVCVKMRMMNTRSFPLRCDQP